MDIQGRSVLILGGSGLVGMAVARAVARHEPEIIVLSGLTRDEAESAVAELRSDRTVPQSIRIEPEWGDLFLPESLRERTRTNVLADPQARAQIIDDLYGELSDDVLLRSAFGSMVLRRTPDIIIDCVNTATAFAYQNVFDSAASLRRKAAIGSVTLEDVECHLATLYLPQLIRHVQIALEAMRRARTKIYVKIGTAGTGGMGLNIPFTHSEERPSRMLLAKSSLAGAHTLLLYLMARTPGAPAVKEIKPTAAISWKRIAYGEVKRRGRPIECYDAGEPVSIDRAFAPDAECVARSTGETLRGVFLDAGENGSFSLGEFETLTALGLMEFITPEEIAENVVREVRGHPTGRDVVSALDAATSGPTYRAGVLRASALQEMMQLEKEHGVEAVAYEMLGPPRLSKLLFEAALLGKMFPDLRGAAELDPDEAARRSEQLIIDDSAMRIRILSIGLPILLADGERMLRGRDVKVVPVDGQSPTDPRLADNGWVDLRPGNWRKWRERAASMLQEANDFPGPAAGSRYDVEPDRFQIRPGRMAAWIFRHEDRGERVKR